LPITHFVGVIFEKLLAAGGEMSFTALVGGRPDRGWLIGAFLALLELIKLRKVRVVQEGFSDIAIRVHQDALRPGGPVERDLATGGREAKEEEAAQGRRVVFMGPPDFAVPALQSLVGAGMPPTLVVTPPDRPAGRGKRLKESPVAVAAKSLGLPILK